MRVLFRTTAALQQPRADVLSIVAAKTIVPCQWATELSHFHARMAVWWILVHVSACVSFVGSCCTPHRPRSQSAKLPGRILLSFTKAPNAARLLRWNSHQSSSIISSLLKPLKPKPSSEVSPSRTTIEVHKVFCTISADPRKKPQVC